MPAVQATAAANDRRTSSEWVFFIIAFSRMRRSGRLLLAGRAGVAGLARPAALCRDLAGLDIVVPVLVVFLRPGLVDLAGTHGLVGAFHTERADVDVAHGAADEQHRRDRMPCPG